MPADSILDHPDFDALDEREKAEAARAMDDPKERERLVLRTVLALRAEQKAARGHCQNVCAPAIGNKFKAAENRINTLERFRWTLVGAIIVIGAIWQWVLDAVRGK